MNIILNGNEYVHNGNNTLISLLNEIGANDQPVAVMIDDNIIKMKDRENITLHEGAKIEIITYATGG